MRYKPVLMWTPAVLWAGAIFGVSGIAGSGLPGGFSAPAHFVEYGVLAMLIVAAIEDGPASERVLLAVGLAAAYAVTDELHQAFVLMRTPEMVDWGVDSIGAAAGALGITVLRSLALHRKRAQ